jgi:cyclic lactone autoinducer peptide
MILYWNLMHPKHLLSWIQHHKETCDQLQKWFCTQTAYHNHVWMAWLWPGVWRILLQLKLEVKCRIVRLSFPTNGNISYPALLSLLHFLQLGVKINGKAVGKLISSHLCKCVILFVVVSIHSACWFFILPYFVECSIGSVNLATTENWPKLQFLWPLNFQSNYYH